MQYSRISSWRQPSRQHSSCILKPTDLLVKWCDDKNRFAPCLPRKISLAFLFLRRCRPQAAIKAVGMLSPQTKCVIWAPEISYLLMQRLEQETIDAWVLGEGIAIIHINTKSIHPRLLFISKLRRRNTLPAPTSIVKVMQDENVFTTMFS